MNRKIAVILPVYRKDKVEYLNKAIESIVMQTYRDYHIYIGVDGPVGDDINAYFEHIDNQNRVTIIRFEENRGLACVLNDLLDICFKDGYEYIARMDADDISETTRFEKQIAFLEKHPGENWTEPMDMLPFMNEDGSYTRDVSCGYTGLLPINNNSFYMVYSDFLEHDKSGNVRKAIKIRKIIVNNYIRR